MAETLVEYAGEVIAFPEGTSQRDIVGLFQAIENGQKAAEINALAEAVGAYIPEPTDYTKELSELAGILQQIRDREEADYNEALRDVVAAVREIDIPAPEAVDFGPVVDAIRDNATQVDVSRLEGLLEQACSLLAEVAAKEIKVTMPKRDKIKSFQIERNSAGNASRVVLDY